MCVYSMCGISQMTKRIPVVWFMWEETWRWCGDSPEGESGLVGPGLQWRPIDMYGPQEATVPWRRFGGLVGEGAAVAQSPQRDASTFRVAAGVEWGAMERAWAQWRGHRGTLKPL